MNNRVRLMLLMSTTLIVACGQRDDASQALAIDGASSQTNHSAAQLPESPDPENLLALRSFILEAADSHRQMTDVLQLVTNRTSAEAALPRVEAIYERAVAHAAGLEALEPPSSEMGQRLAAEFEAFEAAEAAFMSEYLRVIVMPESSVLGFHLPRFRALYPF